MGSPSDVDRAFDEYLHRIELNPARVAKISERYNSVKKQIESQLNGAKVKQVGSFQRKTKIRPITDNDNLDIDALVILSRAERFVEDGLSPSRAMEKVRDSLKSDDTYKTMRPHSDSPVVVLKYADGFQFEFIPAYIDGTGKYIKRTEPASYLVATSKGWMPNDYDYDAECITALNQSSTVQGKLVPFIKIIKMFSRDHEIPLKSFHTELLVAISLIPRLKDWEAHGYTWGYKHMLAEYFSAAARSVQTPAHLSGSVTPLQDSHLSSKQLISIGKDFKTLGEETWKLCKVDGPQGVRAWARFMGSRFPETLGRIPG
ncbi:MAG: hypothetical protein M1596_02890 [Firmicutes bacterium]|nr:hypothetical protein [Bacillota bacterium]